MAYEDGVEESAPSPYAFSIGGVNFNDYSKVKMLTLDSNADDAGPITLHDAGVDYQVPVGKVFIAFRALAKIEGTGSTIGRIGESDTADGAISREVLKLANGTIYPFMVSIIGIFVAGKYVTGESDHGTYTMQTGTVLYGIEVDA